MRFKSGVHGLMAGLTLLCLSSAPLRANWRWLLPASGGNVSQIAMDSSQALYASTNAGLLKSSDFGRTWNSISLGLPVATVNALGVDPSKTTPGVLYVSTSAGLYKSADGGFSWSKLSNFTSSAPVSVIAVAPSDSKSIFVSTNGDYIYRSLDGGTTWTRLTQGLTSAPNAGYMTSMAVDPGNASHVYTSTWRGLLFSSSDAGMTWSQMGDARLWANGQILIAPSNPNVLYTTFDANSFGYTSVLRSADGGNTWLTAGSPYAATNGVSQLAIHPSDPNTVFASTYLGIYKTTDAGAHWGLIFGAAPTLPLSFLNAMESVAINPVNASEIYSGSFYSGFYKSTDGGSTWFPFSNGIAGATFTGIEICASSPSTIYAGIQTTGILKSNDGGATWNPIGANDIIKNQQMNGLGVHPQNPDILVTTGGAGIDSTSVNIYRTKDGGATLAAVENAYGSAYYRFNPLNPNIVDASISDWQGGFYLSLDAGASWAVPEFHYIYPGDYTYHPSLSNVVLSTGMRYTGAPLTTLYVLYSNAGGSAPWYQSASMGQGSFKTLALDKLDPTILYVAGAINSEGTQGIYKFKLAYDSSQLNIVSVSRIAGTFNTGLTDVSVNQLLYDGVNKYLYAATSSGVFRSNDQAASWTSISAGQPNLNSEVLALTPDGTKLLVGTGGGIWQFTDTPPLTPVVSLSLTSLDLGNTPVGSSSDTLAVTLTNTGDGPLTLGNPFLTTSSTEFGASSDCPTTVPKGGQCHISVAFKPVSSPGPRVATLFIHDNAQDSPQTVSLKGNGIAVGTPIASVLPSTIVFSNQPIGTQSSPVPVYLKNVGNADLLITNVTATGSFPTDYSSCAKSLPSILAKNQTCTISVSFQPLTAGTNSGQLQITDNSGNLPGTTQTVNLSGPSGLDTDGDGIPDDWEENGVWVSGVKLDLPAMGAKKDRKDIFVQLDWMASSDHSHRPNLDAIERVRQAFANSPVDNGKGIALHVDCGPDCVMNVDPDTGNRTYWGSLSGAHSFEHIDPQTGNINDLGQMDQLGQYDWSSLDKIKSTSFSPARAGVFHYILFAHDVNLNGDRCSSGLSRSAPADDAIVSLGEFNTDTCPPSISGPVPDHVGTEQQQAGTLMHELGHQLGLKHGGQKDINYKPNYLSVMNYLFQMRGLIKNGQDNYLDFSGFTPPLPTLDETLMSEIDGLGPGASGYGTRYYCPTAKAQTDPDTRVLDASKNIDWNCRGGIEAGLIRAEIHGYPGEYTSLVSYNDWANLKYTGGSIGSPGASAPPKLSTPDPEITHLEDAHITTVYGVAVVAPPGIKLPFGRSATLSFALTNKGTVNDTYIIQASSNQNWPALSGIPTTVSLAAGASTFITVPVTAPSSVVPSQALAVITLRVKSLGSPQITDSASATLAAGSADLRLAISSQPNPVIIGNSIQYAISVTNIGPDPAQDVVVTDTLPVGATLVSAYPALGKCIGSAIVTCGIGELDAGATSKVTVIVKPNTAGPQVDSAGVTSAISDPTPANNSASLTTQVVGKPSLAAQILGQTKAGTTISLSVSVTNVGTGPAMNVSISQVTLKTLVGTGTVVYTAPAVPVRLGAIDVSKSATATLILNVPATVTQFSISERGTAYDAIGNLYSFSSAQSVMP